MKIHQIPIFTDNYVWLVESNQKALIVDPGEAATVAAYLKKHNLNLKTILITHEHSDHVGGVAELQTLYPDCSVEWNKNLRDLDNINFDGENIQVWNTPGHIKNHVSFYLVKQDWLFCGDTLFSLGCGRILEGEFDQGCQELFASLQLIKKRTRATTQVFCTHEYTMKNLAFTQTTEFVIPAAVQSQLEERLRWQKTTLPSTMEFENQWNVFLKAKSLEEFKRFRSLRNNF